MPPPPQPRVQPTRTSLVDADIRFANIKDGETVYQRLLLVEGKAGNIDGLLQVQHDPRSGFAPETWEINQGHFKALVPLRIGSNALTFARRGHGVSKSDVVKLEVIYSRPNTLPLHLAIIAASDSPVWGSTNDLDSRSIPDKGLPVASRLSKAMSKLGIEPNGTKFKGSTKFDGSFVDAPPGPRRDRIRAGGLAEIKKRIAIQAYLWQAFHAEQMRRFGMDRRTFQLDDVGSAMASEEYSDTTRDLATMPQIHILRSRHTLKEFRHPDNAQQNESARNGGAMHAFAQEALEDPATPRFLHSSPVAVLTLDTMWDPQMKLLRGHGAIGGGGPGQISVGVMGSHWLWAAPSSLSGATASFLDTEATHESCVNDLNECPTAWQTLNIGSGAFLHEAGHAFNNPHWPSGVMSRGYVEFNRAFMTREPGCSRNGVANGSFYAPIHSGNDDKHFHLHRAQAVRARWHPSCRLPSDPPLPNLVLGDNRAWHEWNENEPTWTSTPDGAVLSSPSGIGAIEVEFDGDHQTRLEWLNLPGPAAEQPPTQLTVTPSRLSALVGFDVMHSAAPSIKLNALACNMRQSELDDYRQHGVARPLTVPGVNPARLVIKGLPLGSHNSNNKQWSLVFPHERDDCPHARPVLRTIAIFSGSCFDGLHFNYSDGFRAVFGPCGGSPYVLDVASHERIDKIKVRAGAWIDAVEVVLSSGRSSGMRGNTTGGSLHILQPHTKGEAAKEGGIVGLYGSSGAWMDSIGAYTSSI